MLQIDGIIFHLQKYGGISVFFNELVDYLSDRSKNWILDPGKPDIKQIKFNIIERNLKVANPPGVRVFHSSYYRCPQRAGIPTVTTVHDFIHEKFGSGFSKTLLQRQKYKAIKNSEVVACISESTKRDLLEFYPEFASKKIVVIPNGVSTEFSMISDSSESRNQILFIGHRRGYKNFNMVVQALNMLPKYNLLAIGGDDLSSDEKNLINRYIPGRFSHVKGVSAVELNLLYNKSFCLVYPSSYEGFGIPVLESMRAGCPVIAVNASSIPEVAGTAALLMDVPGPDSISTAIKSLEHDYRREEYIRMGLEQSSRFSWKSTFDQYFEIYKELGWVP